MQEAIAAASACAADVFSVTTTTNFRMEKHARAVCPQFLEEVILLIHDASCAGGSALRGDHPNWLLARELWGV